MSELSDILQNPSPEQINNLLYLLSDPSKHIAATIKDHLVTMGKPALSILEQAEPDNLEIATRIAEVIQDIRFTDIKQRFQDLFVHNEQEIDLEQGAFLLARYAYPHLDVAQYVHQLDALAHDARTLVQHRATATDACKVLSHYLFQEKGFRGNTQQFYDPDNSFLNRVMDQHVGIPISLSVLFILVAQRLNLAVVGVGMPGHFLVKLESESTFIDCFNAGAIVTHSDCERFLRESGYGPEPHYLTQSPHHIILARMAKNLVTIYKQQHKNQWSQQLQEIAQLLESGGNKSRS